MSHTLSEYLSMLLAKFPHSPILHYACGSLSRHRKTTTKCITSTTAVVLLLILGSFRFDNECENEFSNQLYGLTVVTSQTILIIYFFKSAAEAFWLLVVSLLWGCTNPLIRRGSEGIENIHRTSPIRQFLAEVYFLALNWKYVVPFLLNQSGSVVYYLTLASVDLSVAVPITNSLTMIITTAMGRMLGEDTINRGTFLGMALVICGVTVCVIEKTS